VSAEPRTWWGWHRLADRWARQLVDHARLGRGDLVLDIGAGTGAITRHLAATGARVIAIEWHPRRAHELRRLFADRNVKVVRADAAELWLPNRPFHVVANPPFGITTALLRRLLNPRTRLVGAELVVPRHVAARWVAGRAPGARRWSHEFSATARGHVPRFAFHPPAPSDAAILSIVRRRARRPVD
jgi:23S rRNA (adenine-N6)-dimethyltransferase